MKKDFIEYLDFDEEPIRKVGRPKLADKKMKKKSLIIASVSFVFVILLLIFGYGTLFGFNNIDLLANITKNSANKNKENILIEEIKPLSKDITLKVGTKRKVYLSISPAAASNKKIKYSSSNKAVATVNKNGVITAVSSGSAKIIATTTDGSRKQTKFNIKIIKDSSGKCSFNSVDKTNNGISYNIDCENAKIKEIQYKIGNGDYEALLTKKLADSVKFSSEQLKKNITLKVVYYPNNSKITKYSTHTLNNIITTKQKTGSCSFVFKEVGINTAKYDIECINATVSKIAYKIGNGSYIGIDSSSLADAILYEESAVTRQLYFNIEYKIDGTTTKKTITRSSIIPNSLSVSYIEEE